MGIIRRVREGIQDLADVFKWPILLGLFFAEALATLVSVGVILQFTYVSRYSLIIGYIGGALVWCLFNSPLLYYVWRRIKEEDSEAKIMSEGWEGSENIPKAVQNYQELLAKQRDKKRRHKTD
jgi:MFS-type transporter involved in bile tolerance (Atg22 family)